MTNDLEVSAPAQLPVSATPDSILAIINRAMTDPTIDVAKLHSFLDLQLRIEAKQAEIAFNIDLQDLQNNMPRVKKDGKIMHSGKLISSYASYDKRISCMALPW